MILKTEQVYCLKETIYENALGSNYENIQFIIYSQVQEEHYKSKKLRMTQLPTKRGLIKQITAYPCSRLLSSRKNLLHTDMDKPPGCAL